VRALRRYRQFEGRANRREYWMFQLWNTVFILAALIVDHALGIASINMSTVGAEIMIGPLTMVYGLAVVIPNIALACRRLHDIGRTGWLQCVAFVPFVGIVVLVFYGLPGQAEANKYGPVPGAPAQVGDPPSDAS